MLTDPIALTCDLIRCPSVTPLEAGCFDLLQGWLESLGFTVWREIFHEEGYAPTENMYARRGMASPNICFAGHIDVVPAGNTHDWTYPPFEPTIKDGILYGRGAEDMKGAIGCMVAAIAHILKDGTWDDNKGSISFLITADEEGIAINGTPKMLTWLEKKGEKLDYCLVGEPTNPNVLGEMCKLGRRGSLLSVLTVHGTQGHVAYPERADNPVTTIIQMLHALKTTTLDSGNTFFQPSNLEITTVDVGNHAHNMIPAKASAEFNVRFNNEYSGESLIAWIRKILDSFGKPYELVTRISGESFLTQRGKLSDALTAAVQKITGKTPELSTTGGTSDARFIKNICPVIEFGTTGHTPHKINERVGVDVLLGLRDIYKEFLLEMMR